MRILFYINSLVTGGAETITVDFAIRFHDLGYEVSVMTLCPENTILSKKLIKNGINIEYILLKQSKIHLFNKLESLFCFNIKKGIHRVLLSFKPDIIHVNSNAKYLNYFLFPTERMIYTFHADVRRLLNIGGFRNKRNLLALAKRGMYFTALTQKMRDDIKELIGTDRVCIVPNGIDFNFIESNCMVKKNFLSSFDIAGNPFILGSVGRFHKVKNVPKIISVFKCLHKKNSNSILILIGTGSELEINTVRKIVHDNNLTDFVYFLGEQENASLLIHAFDAFILPSFSESFSIATIEAQASGVRSLVSTNVPDEVVCNDNCFSLSLDSSDEVWADVLLGHNKKDHKKDLTQFDIKNVVARLEEYYKRVNGDTNA